MKKILLFLSILFLVGVFLFGTGCNASAASRYDAILEDQEGERKLTALARMEESGRITAQIIEPFLDDPEVLIRLRCAEVLGRVADPKGIPYLERFLDDGNGMVVETALFSLGLIGGKEALGPISLCLSGRPRDIKIRALEALGSTRIPEAASLIAPFLKDFHSSIRSGAALAIAALGDSASAAYCRNVIHDPDPHVVASAVYALGRLGYEKSAEDILLLLSHENPEVRLRTAESLGRLEAENAVLSLSQMLLDKNRMVAVKSAEALSRIGNKKSAQALERILTSGDSYLRTVALEGIAKSREKKSYQAVAQLLGDSSLMVRRAALEAAAATGGENARGYILKALETGTSIERMTALQLLGDIGAKEDLPLLAGTLLFAEDHMLREGSASGLGRWKNPKDLGEEIMFEGIKASPLDALLKAADSDDWVTATMAIESLGRVGRPETIGDLTDIFRTHDTRLDGDRRLAVLGTIKSLGKKFSLDQDVISSTVTFLVEASKDPDPRVADAAGETSESFGVKIKPQPSGNWKRGELPWGKPSLPLGERKILLKTERGEIEILLFGDDAPNIVRSVLTLADNKFYDGLTFHRVVPGFVIQGGCPRGDGWGDAGYFLRSQFNLHRYERGTVGMAHAGKDTPGSQIFITHIPQPHLNGRYTVIGKVLKGMEVVDRIEVGDSFTVTVLE